MRRSRLAIAALLCVVASLWWFSRSEAPAAVRIPSDPVNDSITSAGAPASQAPAPPSAAVLGTQEGEPQPAKLAPKSVPQEPVAAALPTPRASGPLAELRQRYLAEPRDSAANAMEATVQATLQHPDIPPELLKSVLCHESVCKLELRWSPARLRGYLQAMTRLVPVFHGPFAATPVDAAGPDGITPIEVYWRRPNDNSP